MKLFVDNYAVSVQRAETIKKAGNGNRNDTDLINKLIETSTAANERTEEKLSQLSELN